MRLVHVRIVFLFASFVHLVVTAVVTLSIDTTVDEDPKVREYYYVRWKLVTCWFNLITLAYLPTRLFCDWRTVRGDGDQALVKRLQHASDVLMTGLLFPIVLYSDGVFWWLYNKDPALLGPPRVFFYLPVWAQHSLHSVSCAVVLLDLLLTPRARPTTLTHRLALLMAFYFTYTFMLLWNYSRGDMVYPVLESMNAAQVLLSALLSLVVILVFFAAQWLAIDYLWGYKTQLKKIS